MGNRSYTSGGGSSLEVHDYVRALNQNVGGKYQFIEPVSGSKVLKGCVCRYRKDGRCIIKVYGKQQSGNRDDAKRIQSLLAELRRLNETVTAQTHPSIMISRLVADTKQALYFSRQYLAYNLYDRFHHRPFFSAIDKHWIAYQLLQAVKQLHRSGVYHGGIKCENIAITTWNWLLLTDVSFYKPAFLPADNPSTYNYFFDAETQRTSPPCYIAPERFYTTSDGAPLTEAKSPAKMDAAMDIFSVGCCLAEIYLDGGVLFDYSQMLRYRTGDYDPSPTLAKIPNANVRALVSHMIQLDPKKRLSAEQYLGIAATDAKTSKLVSLIFPDYFSSLYDLLKKLVDPSLSKPDDKIDYLHQQIIMIVGLVVPKQATASLRSGGGKLSKDVKRTSIIAQRAQKRSSHHSVPVSMVDAPAVISQMEAFLAGLGAKVSAQNMSISGTESKKNALAVKQSDATGRRMISILEQDQADVDSEVQGPTRADGLAIIISVVGACIQSLCNPINKMRALCILETVAEYSADGVVLDILVPTLVSLRGDPSALVRCKVVNLLAYALSRIRRLSHVDINVFSDFLMPIIAKLSPEFERDPIVQIAFCKELPTFMAAGKRFLDLAHALRSRWSDESKHKAGVAETGSSARDPKTRDSKPAPSFDQNLQLTKDKFLKLVVSTLAQGCSKAKIALLQNFIPICEFLGKNVVEEKLVVHLTTMLNEMDWELRAAMFRQLPTFLHFLGPGSFVKAFLAPIMMEALYDSELFVSHQALQALTRLTVETLRTARKSESRVGKKDGSADGRRGPLKPFAREVKTVEKVAPLLLHPSLLVRRAARDFMVALADVLGPARSYQAIFPTLEKYITQRILVVSAESLSEGLMPPIPKATYEKSLAVVGDAKSTPETLASIEYFSGMAASLRGDLHRYFREVINKSNSYNLTRTRKQGKKHARTGSIDVRLMDPGRATKVFSTPLDPFTKSAPQTDSKRFRGKHSAAKAAAEAKAVESIDAPKGTETILQAAFDIPQFSQRQEALPKSPGLSTSWFFRRSRPRRRAEAKRGSDSRSNAWVPQGILVGELSHDAAVNQIEISQDNRFMASCSNDGTVKIWDGTELAKVQTSFVAEPAFVYEEQGGRITGLAICEGTRTIASASTDGSIHVLTVDYSSDSLRGTNFQRIKTEKEGSITAISHAKTPSRSTLVYATQKGYVHGWDFRRKKEAFVLDLKSYVGELGARGFGLVTTTTIGPSNLTLFVGTSHGYIVLWDLRYRLATSIWRHSSKTAILAMSVAGPDAIPVKAKTNTKAPVLLVSAAGAPEISVFDVYTGECRSVLRVVDTANGFPGKSSGNWTKVRTGSVSSDRASGKIPQSESPIRSINPLSLPSLRGCNRRQAGVTEAFVAEFTATACDEKARQGGGRGITCFLCHEGEGVLTGGKDRVVRYWDVNNTERSHRVVKSYEGQFVYRFSRRSENSTVLYEEHTLRQLDASHGAGSAGPTWQLRRGAVSRETVHLDHITDMQAFEFPNKRLVTADRSGRIKIWR